MAKMRMLPFLSQFEGKRFARKRVGDDQFFPPPGHCSLEWRRDENNGEGTVEYLFLGRFCHLNKKVFCLAGHFSSYYSIYLMHPSLMVN